MKRVVLSVCMLAAACSGDGLQSPTSPSSAAVIPAVSQVPGGSSQPEARRDLLTNRSSGPKGDDGYGNGVGRKRNGQEPRIVLRVEGESEEQAGDDRPTPPAGTEGLIVGEEREQKERGNGNVEARKVSVIENARHEEE